MLTVPGVPEEVGELVQNRMLERVFHDALYPRLLFRGEAQPELWGANLGETHVFTRRGLLQPKTKPLTPGSDPKSSSYGFEQWEATAAQYGDAIDTHMPTSYVTLASLYLSNTVTLGLGAGETLNRLVRNALYKAYVQGETVTTAVVGSGATTVPVASINGFTQQLDNGRLRPVSSTNAIPVSFSGSAADNTVIAATPDDPNIPLGPGTLTLSTGLSAGLANREGVRSATRSRIRRVGAGATVDGIASGNTLTLNEIINAVSLLRANKVPPCSDGYYHVHMSPEAEAQIYEDNHFQRLHQSLPDSAAYRDLGIGQLVGCRFYRNTETPNEENVGDLIDTSGSAANARLGEEVLAEVINASGIPIRRTIVVGGSSIYEKYLDESKFITAAGVTGKIGEFSVTNGGVQVMTDRIRYIARAPLDKLQQVYSQAWSWSGDFPVPSDALTGNTARFKRAQVIEHA